MENKNNFMLVAVVGVATLIMAITGATFAFFAASANATGNSITGDTLELSDALSVSVTRVIYASTTAPSLNLVPTNLTGTTAAGITAAVSKKCESNGYTGCHVYKIEAQSTQAVSSASINLASLTVDATVASDWKYSIYQGTDTSATTFVKNGTFPVSSAVDMHSGKPLAANTKETYYLVIYLQDDGAIQNAGNTNDATGTYTGTVTMTAGTGSVMASFSAS